MMKFLISAMACLTLLLSVGCSEAPFDFKHKSPVDFLTFLHDRQSYFGLFSGSSYIISPGDIPADWIKPQDVPELLKLIPSQIPSSSVASSASSYISKTDSTIGNEALQLLEGYRNGKYPPLNSRPACGDNDCPLPPRNDMLRKQAELTLWWQTYQGDQPEDTNAP